MKRYTVKTLSRMLASVLLVSFLVISTAGITYAAPKHSYRKDAVRTVLQSEEKTIEVPIDDAIYEGITELHIYPGGSYSSPITISVSFGVFSLTIDPFSFWSGGSFSSGASKQNLDPNKQYRAGVKGNVIVQKVRYDYYQNGNFLYTVTKIETSPIGQAVYWPIEVK